MSRQGKTEYNLNGKGVMLFLLFLAILANLKSIFFDCEIDVEYAVAMSYRMFRGDNMLQQMWEPHQTSAFLGTLLMKPFVAVTGTTTGIVVYLNACGVLLHGVVVWIFYSFLKKRVDINTAGLMSIFFLAARPKDIVFPEFSNMQLWFSVLFFISLLCYFEKQEQKYRLLLSSVFLCLEIISYPSCVIVWLPVMVLLWMYSETKWKDMLLFTGACAVQGCVYAGYFIVRTGGIAAFLKTLENIVSGDASHQAGDNGMGFFFWENLSVSVVWLAGSLLVAFLVNKFWVSRLCKLCNRSNQQMTREQQKGRFFLLAGILGLLGLAIQVVAKSSRMAHVSLYLVVIILALFAAKGCEAGERRMVYVGMTISISSCVATALLTNLDISATLMYLVLAVMVAFIPLKGYRQQEMLLFKKVVRYDVLIIFCLLCLFQRGVYVKLLGGYSSPLEIGGIVKVGPELGIFADYMGANIRNVTLSEWDTFVQDGDNVLIVEKEGTSTIGYLYNDTGVSAPSTICTPTFDEQLLEYWELYPEKYPDVVAVQCWYGEPLLEEDSWMMQWLNNEFRAESIEDGTYWRFYRGNIY